MFEKGKWYKNKNYIILVVAYEASKNLITFLSYRGFQKRYWFNVRQYWEELK